MGNHPNYLNHGFILEEIGLKQGMKVGDLGCGSGYMTFAASDIVGKNGIVYAVDIQKKALEHIESEINEKGISNIKPIWSNLEIFGATNIPDKELDIGLLVNVIFLSQQKEELLKESVRMVKTGGLILGVEWKSSAIPFGPSVEQRVLVQDLKDLFVTADLKRIKEFDVSNHHYGVLYRV